MVLNKKIREIVDLYMNLKLMYKVGIAVVICLMIFIVIKKETSTETNTQQRKMIFSVKNIKSEKRSVEVKTTGYIRPYKILNIMAIVPGKISNVYVKNGQFVNKGDVLLELNKKDLLENLKASEVSEKNSKAKYDAAESLHSQGFVTEIEVRDLLSAFQSSKEKKLKSKQDVEYAFINAPFDGYVSNLKPDEGDYTSSVSGPIMKLLDMSTILVETSIGIETSKSLIVGDYCKVVLRGKSYDANIHDINKTLDATTKSSLLKVIIKDENLGKNVFDGEVVDVLLYSKETLVNKLNASWIGIDDSGILGIKIIENDIPKFVPVTIVDDDNDYVFITSISDDYDIITDGHEFADSGQKIDISQIVKS